MHFYFFWSPAASTQQNAWHARARHVCHPHHDLPPEPSPPVTVTVDNTESPLERRLSLLRWAPQRGAAIASSTQAARQLAARRLHAMLHLSKFYPFLSVYIYTQPQPHAYTM